MAAILISLSEAILLYVGATIAFDVVHYLLHRFKKSRLCWCRAIASLHDAHHRFLPETMQIDARYTEENLFMHVVPEFLTRGLFVIVFIPFLGPGAPLLVLGVFAAQLIGVYMMKGEDSNHHSMTRIKAPGNGFFVGARYHAYHHMFPERYYSSFVKLFDYVFGFSVCLEGKVIVMTGSNGSFGNALFELLQKEKVKEIRRLVYGQDYNGASLQALDKMRDADILILCHGSKRDPMNANYHSFVALIERFAAVNADRRIPVEIWALGSESEFHPAIPKSTKPYSDSKRAYAAYASSLYRRKDITYRHIVPSSFSSPLGPGLISGRTAALIAMWFIKRGCEYVPVTYTGFAFLNFFKFKWQRSR